MIRSGKGDEIHTPIVLWLIFNGLCYHIILSQNIINIRYQQPTTFVFYHILCGMKIQNIND